MKYWRPKTILNNTIIVKVMAIRPHTALSYIINEDQTGYIKARFIEQNIRIIEDVYFTEIENLPRIILTIDLEKAFDSINLNFIDNALGLFNLGPNFRKMCSNNIYIYPVCYFK